MLFGWGRVLQLYVDLGLEVVLLIVLAHGGKRLGRGRFFILERFLGESCLFLTFLDVAFPQLLLVSGGVNLGQLVVGGVSIIDEVLKHFV